MVILKTDNEITAYNENLKQNLDTNSLFFISNVQTYYDNLIYSIKKA